MEFIAQGEFEGFTAKDAKVAKNEVFEHNVPSRPLRPSRFNWFGFFYRGVRGEQRGDVTAGFLTKFVTFVVDCLVESIARGEFEGFTAKDAKVAKVVKNDVHAIICIPLRPPRSLRFTVHFFAPTSAPTLRSFHEGRDVGTARNF